MSNHEFKPGDKVRYDSGSGICKDVIVVGTHPKNSSCTVVYYKDQFIPLITSWLEPDSPHEVKGWVNIYENTHRDIFYYKQLADTAAKSSSSKRIACVFVTGTEGIEP